jgi:hypothetical protein
MCCSAWPATFSKTITGTLEVLVEERLNHVMWYQNNVGNGDKKSIFNQGSGNCLIIPLLGEWQSIKLLNTLETPNLLNSISKALALPVIQMDTVFGAPRSVPLGTGGIVFLKFDIYDIVLAERARDIPNVLPQIQKAKRPTVNEAVFDVMDKWYGCPVAVCCFNTLDQGTAKPLGFAFEPLYPDKLVVYTLDGHDGNPPDPRALVDLDHDIFVGSYLMPSGGAKVYFKERVPDHLRPYLVNRVLGVPTSAAMENGDFIFSTEAVRAGHFEGVRSLPPFGPHELPRLGHTLTRTEHYVTQYA